MPDSAWGIGQVDKLLLAQDSVIRIDLLATVQELG